MNSLLPPNASSASSPTVEQRVLGVVLGAAIGDAMGHPVEFLSMAEIQQRYGEEGLCGYELYWTDATGRYAPYTDDTQMAEVVLAALVDNPSAELAEAMTAMAAGFIQWAESPQGGHRAPGNACLAGARALAQGIAWDQAGGAAAGGCGSVMRAYPFGIVFAEDLEKAEAWSVAHSKLTHRDPIALAACAAMAVGVALSLRGAEVAVVCGGMIEAAARHSPETAAMMSQALHDAENSVGPDITLDRLRAWAAHEAIAAAVYIFARHPDDARAAILEGANTPGDSDSIATLAGALVGSRVGAAGLPDSWRADLERAEELSGLALRAAALRA
ncbi:MAG: ADP-ribosylglycohydrolase family protein [Angustibacter sp.]